MFEDDLLEDGQHDLIEKWESSFQTPPPPTPQVSAAETLARTASKDDIEDFAQPIHSSAAQALDKPFRRPRLVTVDNQPFILSEKPVAFSSRATKTSETKMWATELELSCFAWAFEKFRHYLEGAKVTVVTDHAPLGSVVNAKSHRAFTMILEKQRQFLSQHAENFRFVYKQGHKHKNVDALSRLPVP
ncbi:unnamed protein product [Jaminaea pallidilutea]